MASVLDIMRPPRNLAVALQWIAAGVPVHPCHSEGEKAKAPRLKGWQAAASTDEVTVRAWWAQWPDALVGLHLAAAGLIVIDADRHGGPDGVAGWESLCAEYGFDQSTHPIVSTGGGGLHIYSRAPAGLEPTNGEGSLPAGINVRWAGFTIAPGCVLPDGRRYDHVDGTPPLSLNIPEAPPWLIAMIGTARRAADNQTPLCDLDAPEAVERARAFLRDRDEAVEGQGGNNWTYATVCHLRDLGLSEPGVLDLLTEEWNEKCAPPWPLDELADVVANAYSYGQNAPGAKTAAVDFRGVEPLPPRYLAKASNQRPLYLQGVSAAALMAKTFRPVRYVVPGYIVEGLTILGGAPKLGKSWLALNVAVAVASPDQPCLGDIAVEHGDVLYLALEDNERRLQRRLQHSLFDNAPERLTLVTKWPTLDEGCVTEMAAWAGAVERPTLIIVDVLARVRGALRRNETQYDADYRAVAALQQFAGENAIAMVVVHHTRKMASDDPFDQLSGTRGLTGAADSVLLLTKDNVTGRSVIYGRGRDIEEIETAVIFDRNNGRWTVIGAAHEVARSDERQAILDAFLSTPNSLSARDIAVITKRREDTVRVQLGRMVASGEALRTGRGLYTCNRRYDVTNLSEIRFPPSNITLLTEDIKDGAPASPASLF